LGSDHQHEDEDEQCRRVFEVGRQKERGKLNDQTNNERADECSVGRPEATEYHCGKHQQENFEAHQPRGLTVEGQGDTRNGGQGAPQNPHELDNPLRVDTRRFGQRRVVGDGSCRAPHSSSIEEEPKKNKNRAGNEQSQKGSLGESHGTYGNHCAEPTGIQLHRSVHEEQVDVAQHDRQADADNHQLHQFEPLAL
jgi:hypothetical protein